MISDSQMKMKFNGENICIVGYENGFGKITAESSNGDIRIEGHNCFVIGSKDKNAEIALSNCKGSALISSANPHMIYATKGMVTVKDCDFKHS